MGRVGSDFSHKWLFSFAIFMIRFMSTCSSVHVCMCKSVAVWDRIEGGTDTVRNES